MEGRALTNLLVLSLASFADRLSGQQRWPEQNSDEGGAEGAFQGMDYIECMEHEDMEMLECLPPNHD